jgi:hypothetical protein
MGGRSLRLIHQGKDKLSEEHLETKFKFYEIVRVVVQPPRIRETLIYKEGIVVGMSEPNNHNHRDYGVHINEYGETFAIPEHALESAGRFGSRQDVVSRRSWE